jgi:hypothetical protein
LYVFGELIINDLIVGRVAGRRISPISLAGRQEKVCVFLSSLSVDRHLPLCHTGLYRITCLLYWDSRSLNSFLFRGCFVRLEKFDSHSFLAIKLFAALVLFGTQPLIKLFFFLLDGNLYAFVLLFLLFSCWVPWDYASRKIGTFCGQTTQDPLMLIFGVLLTECDE